MKTLTAKTPEEVKQWIAENQHHNGAWVTKWRSNISMRSDEPAFFKLRGHNATLFIPIALHTKCFLTPYGADADKMYRWDDIAEKAAPDFGKRVTTSANTLEWKPKIGYELPCGVRQGVLTGVDYLYIDKDVATPYYLVEGEVGKYAMLIDPANPHVVVGE